MDINSAIQLASQYHQQGNLQQAEIIYRKILEFNPRNCDILNYLGNVLQDQHKIDEAIACYQKALQIQPNYAGSYFNLGKVFEKLVQTEKAIYNYQKAIEYDPNFCGSYNNLGNIFRKLEQEDKSIPYFEKAIEINPNYWGSYYNLGEVLQNKGHIDEAISLFQKTLQLNPRHNASLNNLGNCLTDKGLFDEAMTYYQKALQLTPNHAQVYTNLGNIYLAKGQLEEAEMTYQKALQIEPSNPETYYMLGKLLMGQGKQDEAINAFDTAIKNKPDSMKARWARCMAQIPIIYPDRAGIESSRQRYYKELVDLSNNISLVTSQDIKAAAEAVGSSQPFYLAYQGLNDRELQELYGDMVCRIMALRFPQWAERPVLPAHLPEEPLRVGIVSRFFCLHSVWKIPMKGWIEHLDKNRFSLYGYYTGKKQDRETETAKNCFTRFVQDIYSFEDMCRIIRDDNLHILLYPEIGMDPITLRLAALRLAPVQCVSWGHPETSGFPTIDYYLSSDLIEPSAAEGHYRERLIRLPNLSMYYTPLEVPCGSLSRHTFGLRPSSILYHCCQTLYKHSPNYDEVFPRIAQQVGDCQFLFSSFPNNRSVIDQFRLRLNHVFDRFGLNAEDHVVFLPLLSTEDYQALHSLCDIYLDSIGWSGCNSILEALACNMPVVTLPTALMRGREGFAILTMMGMTETIASSIDEYIELAVRLGIDLEWRKQISEKVGSLKDTVYRDQSCITALEDFLEKASRERL